MITPGTKHRVITIIPALLPPPPSPPCDPEAIDPRLLLRPAYHYHLHRHHDYHRPLIARQLIIDPRSIHRSRAFLALLCMVTVSYISSFMALHSGRLRQDHRSHLRYQRSPGDRYGSILLDMDLESRPFVVTHTNLGWNTPKDKEFPRRIISGELYHATRNHTHYNASAWADLERHPDPSSQIIAFMDVETCFEVNFPIYGPRKFP
jgi:hypothetical protein